MTQAHREARKVPLARKVRKARLELVDFGFHKIGAIADHVRA